MYPKLKSQIIRTVLGWLSAIITLTAIGEGTAILTGTDRFPLACLEGTSFNIGASRIKM